MRPICRFTHDRGIVLIDDVKTLPKNLTRKLALGAAIGLLSVLTCFLITPSVAQNDSPCDPVTGAIQAVYDQIDDAFNSNHIERIPEFLTDDYTETDPHGQILDINASMRKLRDERNQISTIQCQLSIVSVTPAANGLLVEMKLHSFGTGQKRIAFFKIHGTFTNDLVTRDLWVETPAGWRIKTRLKLVDDSHTEAG
jgi:hypothetical protein